MSQEFDWTASDKDMGTEASRLYDEQAEPLGIALMVNKQALLWLSSFAEHASDHDRIAACRRAFRVASRHVKGAKVRTTMLRDSSDNPVAVIGYVDAPPTEDDLRNAMSAF